MAEANLHRDEDGGKARLDKANGVKEAKDDVKKVLDKEDKK